MDETFKRITRKDLVDASVRVVQLAAQYRPRDHHREMGYDGLLFGFLDAKFGKWSRQHQIRLGRKRVPKRIDFRQGGTSPVLVEFAVRTPGRNEIHGSQNAAEIQKLTRQKKASARYLLLLDMSRKPAIEKARLKATYERVTGGRGNFKRFSVCIVYVHPDEQFHFHWRPNLTG